MDEQWTLEDSLSGVCADLLSERRFEPFARRLFSSPPGVWRTVAGCCVELPELPRHAAELFAGHAAALVVTHLPWPKAESDGYSLVLFVHREEYYHRGDEREQYAGQAQIIIAKQRNGPVGEIKLEWLRDFTRFQDPVPDRLKEFDQFNDHSPPAGF